MSMQTSAPWTAVLSRVAVLLICVSGLACGQPSAPAKPKSIAISNVAEVRARVGQQVSLTGKVTSTGQSSSGHQFLNFSANRGFSVVIRKEDVKKFTGPKPSITYRNQHVVLTGKLEKYKDKVQLRLTSPEQIRIVKADAAEKNGKLPEPIELKKVGEESWVSPAGLRYTGRDPEGRSRLAHVLRHAVDQPDRDGPHGVFDGGEDYAFAWIDEAWKQIESRKLKPQIEGQRVVYTVSLGRRVGYLGGSLGRRKGKPPLTKVFLVLRKGTNEVITAFPR